MEPQEMIAENDLLAVRATATGTHDGEFVGMPASGKRIEVEFYDLLRFRDGQITEHWGLMDVMTMMQQLGAIPARSPA
jgi:predicted ester cyclase